MVRPWKDPSAATSRVRPVRRVSLRAASLASVPELLKNTRPVSDPLDHPSRPRSRSASSTCGSVLKKLETWPRVDSWAVTASTRAGWACPRVLTAMPPSRSTYSLPSVSHTRAPRPRDSASAGGPKVFMTAEA